MSATQKASVLRQVEYYFSDVSLPYDEFLKKAYDENGAAIPIATIADSPRIIKICDGLDQAARQALVSEVISAESDSVKVVDGKLTRIYPLPDDDDKAMRSVYLGGCSRSLTAEAAASCSVSSAASGSSSAFPASLLRGAAGAPLGPAPLLSRVLSRPGRPFRSSTLSSSTSSATTSF